jgi:hypothetical protein
MATAPKNYTTSNKLMERAEAWTEALGDFTPMWARFAKLVGQPGDPSVRLYHDGMPTKLGDFTSTLPTFAVGAADNVGPVVTLTGSGKGLSAQIKIGDYKRDPGIVDRMAAQLVRAAQATIDSVVFAALNTANSDTYTNVTTGGSATPALIGAAHKTYDENYTQDNDIAAALSDPALNSAVATLHGWRGWADEGLLHLGYGGKTLIVPSALEATALKLVGSRTLPFADNGNVGDSDNPRMGQEWSVVSNGELTSASRWFVVDNDHNPISVFIPIAPEIRIYEGANFLIQVECALEVGCAIAAPPAGLVGSSA